MSARAPERMARRTLIARALRAAVAAAQTTYERLSQLTSAQAQHLTDASRDDGVKGLQCHDLIAMPDEIRVPVCATILGDRFVVSEVPQHKTDSDHLQLVHDTHADVSALVAQVLMALADGLLTAAEANAIANAADRAGVRAQQWKQVCRQAQRERVIGVSRGGR